MADEVSFGLLFARTIDEAVAMADEHKPRAILLNHIYPQNQHGYDLLAAELKNGPLHTQIPLKILYTSSDLDLTELDLQAYKRYGLSRIYSRLSPRVLPTMLRLVEDYGRRSSQSRTG